MKALEVKPDQTAAVYERTARLLYGAGSYANAMDVANKLIDRFGKTAKDDAERQAVLDARILVAQSYARMEKWDEALGRLKALHQEAPNHLELRIDLAKALLAAKQYAEAAKLWREIAEGLRHGSESWFQARTALAQSMVRAGNKAAAYKNLLTVVVTWHPLPSPLYKTHFQQPVEELIQKEMGADYWKQYQEAIANLKAPAGATDADKF
jgi:tetratricopeptide (TPR) repeat protein